MQVKPPNRSVPRVLLALAAFGWLSLAAAHAHLDLSSPGDREVVTEPITELSLTFTEPVETEFSRFELVRLDVETRPDGYAPGGAAWAALEEAAQAAHDELVAQGDAAQPAGSDAGTADEPTYTVTLQTEGAAAEVVLAVEGELPTGDYILFFNVLSVDTHTSSGYVLFSYQPEY